MEDKVKNLKNYLDILIEQWLSLAERWELARLALMDQRLVQRFNDSVRARGFDVIRRSLAEKCLIVAGNLFSKPEKHEVSLEQLINPLCNSNEPIYKALEQDFTLFRKTTQEIVSKYSSLCDPKTGLGTKIRKVRNKLTHFDTRDDGDKRVLISTADCGLIVSDIDEITDEIGNLCEKLHLVIGNSSIDFKHKRDSQKKSAEAYWELDQDVGQEA